jgi:hypothetical protein
MVDTSDLDDPDDRGHVPDPFTGKGSDGERWWCTHVESAS